MLKALLSWKLAAAVIVTFSVFGVLNATVLQDRFCPVIDDFTMVNTGQISQQFDQAKIAYFVDFNSSKQILVQKSQLNDAKVIINNLGIKPVAQRLTANCRVVH